MSFDFNAVMLYSKGLVVIYCVWFPVTLLASTRGYPWMLAATWSSTRPTSSWIWASLRKLMSCWPFARRLCCLGESCLGMSRLHWLCALRACTFLSQLGLYIMKEFKDVSLSQRRWLTWFTTQRLLAFQDGGRLMQTMMFSVTRLQSPAMITSGFQGLTIYNAVTCRDSNALPIYCNTDTVWIESCVQHWPPRPTTLDHLLLVPFIFDSLDLGMHVEFLFARHLWCSHPRQLCHQLWWT